MYNGKFIRNEMVIEHIGKETYFRDVHLFVEQVRDLALIKDIGIIRENL